MLAVAQGFLWVALLLCLIGPTAGFELEARDWEGLGSGVASLHRLKGFADRITQHPFRAEDDDDDYNLGTTEESHGHHEDMQLRSERRKWNTEKKDSHLSSDTSLIYREDDSMIATFRDLHHCPDFAVCILQKQEDVNRFLDYLDGKKSHDTLLFASEVSYTYRNKLILILDNEPETLIKAEEEYSEDPYYSTKVNMTCLESDSCSSVVNRATIIKIIGSISEDGDTLSGYSGSSLASIMLNLAIQKASLFSITDNISITFRNNFMRVFKSYGINAVLENTLQNDYIYQIMDETGKAVEYQIPKRPVAHMTHYDTQHILIMQDDHVVRDAVTFLYEKHPTVSSVYILKNQRPKLIKGDPVPVSAESHLVLVGHGDKGWDSKTGLVSYTAEEVADIIERMNLEKNQIRTTSVVGCDVGSDETFWNTLLKELHARSIETELHLRTSLVQISHSGQKITGEIRPDGIIWRHSDDRKKVVLTLDRNGEVVTQIQSGNCMEEIYSDERNVVGHHFEDLWPTKPGRFVSESSREPHTDDLEGLSWAFFYHRKGNGASQQLRCSVNSDTYMYTIYNLQFTGDGYGSTRIETGFFTEETDINDVLNKCYEITSGEDIVNVISHFASVGEDNPTYIMLNDWIYKLFPDRLYIFPVGKRFNINHNEVEIKKIIEEQFDKYNYPDIRNGMHNCNGNDLYAQYARETLQGNYKKGTFNPTQEAWLSTYFLASVISESSRNFRTFPIVLMAMDMALSQNKETANQGLEFLLEKQPMTKGGTWINRQHRGFHGASTEVIGDSQRCKNLRQLTREEEAIITKWLSTNGKTVTDTEMLNRLVKLAYGEDKLNMNPSIKDHFKESYEHFITEINTVSRSGVLGGLHDGPVALHDVHSAADVESSLKLSSYYSRSSSLLAEHVHSELQRTFGEKVQELNVKPDSVIIKDGEFHCALLSKKNPHEIRKWKLKLPSESQIQIEKIWESMDKVSATPATHMTSEHLEQAGMALGTMGLMLGAQGAVRAFEQGDVVQGTMATLETTHEITGMTLAAVGKQISVTAGSKVMNAISTALKNPVTKRTLVVLPVVGIGFSIYNIVEDIKRSDTVGYIDAGLDSFILVMDVVEFAVPVLAPIITPINFALSVIRMAIDDIYFDIQAEFNKLPSDATILDKIGAFFKGLGEGIVHFILDIASFFVTVPYREIENGRRLVERISDYQKYYSRTEVQAGRKAIDFTGGESSWNGGGITFCLSDQGPSEFCMDYFVSADESIGRKCWSIDTDQTDDVVLGTGESHQLEYSNIQIKVLLFIPVGTRKVISGYKEINYSRYGEYSGNSKENNFFAVQSNPDTDAMEVMLSYYYRLYGKEGDDTFYLGPQRSYVEGQGGKDMYIIPKDGGNTIINNYDPQKTVDVLILSVNYHQISVTKSGDSVILKYCDDHNVMIKDWFTGEEYRHINIMSDDGVLFGISPTVISAVKLVSRGVNLMSKPEGQTVDTTEPLLVTVTNIMGSPHNDRLIGNAQKNMIDGGGGSDYMKGGEGEDVYVVNEKKHSKVQIENYSMDKEMDMIIIEANLHAIKTKLEGNHLILMPFSDIWSDVTLINWFRSEEDRHLLVVTKDLITFNLSADKFLCSQSDPVHSKCILSQSIDYSKSPNPLVVDLEAEEAFQNVTEVRGSNLNDNIKGNAQGNTIMPGDGADFLQGRGGQDWYIITPSLGLKTIDNYSPDLTLDMLLLKENYELIGIKCSGQDLNIFINDQMEVQLKQWFSSVMSQHLQVRTADGIIFNLQTDSSKCGDNLKLPLTVDYRTKTSDQIMRINYREFVSVVEMYGSTGYDIMIGNDKDNLLDPFTGGGIMDGGEGKDTYTVKPEYGTQIVIDNFAVDEKEDTVLFQAEFLTSPITVHAENYDVIISANEKGQDVKVRMRNYRVGQKHQHLSFQSSDGVHFWVRAPIINQSQVLQDPWIEPYKVILKDKQLDCHIHLGSQRNLSTVYTVQGCSSQSNNIEGNDLDNALFGGLKHDIIDGGDGHDTLTGGQGNDILLGSTGNDTLYGEDGDDILLGGPGWDSFIPGPGADVMDGGSGRDTVLYQGDHGKGEGVYVNLLSGEGHQADAEGDVLKDVENVIGTIYSDILVSGYEPALLKGSDGDDILVSVVDGDYLIGGEGRDVYMMVPHHGWITIDNCAEDNSTDILYLPSVTGGSAECNKSSSGLSLKFHTGDSTFMGIFLKDWVNTTHNCGHLSLIMRGGMVSVETLQQNCKFRNVPKIMETTIIVGLVVIAHVIGLVLLKKCWRMSKQRDGESAGNTHKQTSNAEERSEKALTQLTTQVQA